MSSASIAERLQVQRERVAEAARRAGRAPEQVTLVAVSKKHPAAAIREAYAAGQRDFGENYVQELVAKAAELADCAEIRWHLIGHLQSNKARQIAGIVEQVHTVSSVKLARELNLRLEQKERESLDVLIHVNVSGEESKSGCQPEEARAILEAVGECPRLRAVGLMTMPPASEEAEDARPHFEALVALRDELGGPSVLPELSLGMSHDAEVAISAGSTMVRIGSAIFGARES